MIYILHYLEGPKLWELWYIFLLMGNAGFLSSTLLLGPLTSKLRRKGLMTPRLAVEASFPGCLACSWISFEGTEEGSLVAE